MTDSTNTFPVALTRIDSDKAWRTAEEPPDVPSYKNYRLYADESGFHSAPYYGFGALIIAHERRGDLTALVAKLREEHGIDPTEELKWSRLSKRNIDFALALVDQFFQRTWMAFHCMVVESAYVDMQLHDRKIELARRKHWALFLRKKVELVNSGRTDRAFHIIVDRPPYSYAKADEVAHKIINAELKRDLGSPLVRSLTSCDSRRMVGIQVGDLLLGGVLAARQGDVTAEAKLRFMDALAQRLGWPDLTTDTLPNERKFNIWNFQNPKDARRSSTRAVGAKTL